MDWIHEWWAQVLFGLALVGGMLKYLFAHNAKHREVDNRLLWGNTAFDKNDDDHEEIKVALKEEQKKSSAAIHGIKELLVHFKIREPGESINGEEK